MVTTQEIMEQLTGKGIVQELVSYMEQNFEDFPEVHRKYIDAVERLQIEQGKETTSAAQDVVAAIEGQTASSLFFSGVLGIKANLDHYFRPMDRTILDADFELVLREDTARRLPDYEKNQMVIEKYLKALLPDHKEAGEEIIEYISYLETVGPKLAHFYGFIWGDQILQKIVPGYHPDKLLTNQYKVLQEMYLGCSLEI